jgi:hypothetical protein
MLWPRWSGATSGSAASAAAAGERGSWPGPRGGRRRRATSLGRTARARPSVECLSRRCTHRSPRARETLSPAAPTQPSGAPSLEPVNGRWRAPARRLDALEILDVLRALHPQPSERQLRSAPPGCGGVVKNLTESYGKDRFSNVPAVVAALFVPGGEAVDGWAGERGEARRSGQARRRRAREEGDRGVAAKVASGW